MLIFYPTFSILAFTALTTAVPTELQIKSKLVTPTITVCTGSLDPRDGCADIPLVLDTCNCVNFIFNYGFLNDKVSNAQIPLGISCTFFSGFACISTTDTDVIFLQGGTYDFFNVPGIFGPVNFNDMASSFTCSVG